MAEQTFRTEMRTADILVTASFSPAAVTAIGLADLHACFPLRTGLGGGAIAYLGAGLTWIWMAAGVLLGFHYTDYYTDWATRAAHMMAERGSLDTTD